MSDVPPGSEPIEHAPAGTTIDSLLVPGPGSNDKYVQLGDLRVEKQIFNDFKAAERYLGTAKEAVDTLYKLEHGGVKIDVHETAVGNDSFGPLHDRNTIYWAPKGALTNTDGSQQSPAMGLLHEEGHAARFIENPKQYNIDAAKYTDPTMRSVWTTPEERRNIEGLESRVGKVLHEGHRDDHSGTPYESRGPTSIESTAELKATRDAAAGRIAQLRADGHPMPAIGDGPDAIVPNDGKAHTGSFADLQDGRFVQSIGKNQYMLYPAGSLNSNPPEANPHSFANGLGTVTSPSAPAQSQNLSLGMGR